MEEIKEILSQQMSLLVEKAKDRKDDTEDLTKLSFEISNIARAMTNCNEKEELLSTLKNMDSTLKRIEQTLMSEKKHECNCGKSAF